MTALLDTAERIHSRPMALQSATRQPQRPSDLPPGQRQALELIKFRETSLKEASALTGISIGALKVSVHRATKTLRRSLNA